MSRHQAADGAAAHPLVDAALRRRVHATQGVHRAQLPGTEGPIGWPGPDHGDERTAPIGWPGGLPPGTEPEDAASDDEPVHPEARVPELRRGRPPADQPAGTNLMGGYT